MLWILLLLGACGVVGVMVYNRLVIAQNQYRNAFSQIGVQLQRRHDLIPNLVAAAKGYLKFCVLRKLCCAAFSGSL